MYQRIAKTYLQYNRISEKWVLVIVFSIPDWPSEEVGDLKC